MKGAAFACRLIGVGFAGAHLALSGCGALPHTRAAGAVTPLSVHPVAWNPANAEVGRVRAVADTGPVVAVFGDEGAYVFASGAWVATFGAVKDWVDADTLRGEGGVPAWIVGIDAKGQVYSLRNRSTFEDVSARYGVGGRHVRGAAMLDGERVGFLLDQGIAVADGLRSTQYTSAASAGWRSLAGGGGWGAAVSPDAVTLFNAATLASITYALPGVTRAAVGPDGRLYAATSRALYRAKPGDDLALIYDAEKTTLHGLVVSGQAVWFADGMELGVVEGDHVAETTHANVPANGVLAASPSGDVWVLSEGHLQRVARADGDMARTRGWSATLAALFARDCSSCHLPGGVSGTDLSSDDAWQKERSAIHERVVVRRTMPPRGKPMPDADRNVIRQWTERAP